MHLRYEADYFITWTRIYSFTTLNVIVNLVVSDMLCCDWSFSEYGLEFPQERHATSHELCFNLLRQRRNRFLAMN